jgi:hypothetical protein
VLPQSFGTFSSKTPTLHCVCDQCNGIFKKELDQPFARDTLEGITRYKKGILSREVRVQKGMQFSIAADEEAGEFGGVLVEGIDGTSGKTLGPVAQFHVLNVTTGRYAKFSKDQIRDLKLPEDVYGKPTERKYRVFAPSREEHDAVVEELRKAGMTYRERERFRPALIRNLEAGETVELPLLIEGIIDDVRKRALVKILFNFATYYLGQSETSKPQWDKARQFVRYGGETLLARMTSKPFWDGQETENFRFPDDSYNLRIENYRGNVIGGIQFYNLFTYEFILVEDYSLPPDKEVGYRFTPGEEPYRGIKLSTLPPF